MPRITVAFDLPRSRPRKVRSRSRTARPRGSDRRVTVSLDDVSLPRAWPQERNFPVTALRQQARSLRSTRTRLSCEKCGSLGENLPVRGNGSRLDGHPPGPSGSSRSGPAILFPVPVLSLQISSLRNHRDRTSAPRPKTGRLPSSSAACFFVRKFLTSCSSVKKFFEALNTTSTT